MTFDALNAFLKSYSILIWLSFGIFASLALYFVFGRKAELSKNAFDNTIVTILMTVINTLCAFYFNEEINAFMQSAYGLLHIPTLPAEMWNAIPFALACILGVVISDFSDYWTHRFMHTKWGWPAHAGHHSDSHVNAFTTFRMHYMESVTKNIGLIFLLTWMQIPEALPIVYVTKTLFTMYTHMDLDINHGPFRYLIASPTHHRWHHADVPAAYGKNLANVVPLFDVMFGTYYMPGPCHAEMGAKKTGVVDTNLWALMIYPFVEWSKLFREVFAQSKEHTSPTDTAQQHNSSVNWSQVDGH